METLILRRWPWRRLGPMAGLAIAAALGLAVAFAGGASAQSRAVAATVTYTDASGDSGAAPDITNVTVSGDPASGSLTFSVTAVGYQPASADGQYRSLWVWIDSDKNASTGDPQDGTEFGIGAVNDAGALKWGAERWDGARWVSGVSATTSASHSGDTITWQLNASDLGGSTSFRFYVYSRIAPDANSANTAHDEAPDGVGWWTYDPAGSTATTTTAATTTATASAPPRSMTVFYSPTIAQPATVPARLVAGAHVTLAFRVTRDQKPLKSGKMVCNPTVAGKVIPHTASFGNGVARLAFIVPKTAKGRLVKVVLTITPPSYQGPDGVYIDAATGLTGVLHTSYEGRPTTKVVTFRVH
jgi:hypothetical protein